MTRFPCGAGKLAARPAAQGVAGTGAFHDCIACVRFAELAELARRNYDVLRLCFESIGGGMNAVFTLRQDSERFLEVGDQLVDTDTLRVLTRPEGTRLTPKAAAVLLQLARNSG